MGESYAALAQHYDSLMRDFDYDRTLKFILAETIGCKTALDLACGTGKMTIRLKKVGIATEGLDSSEQMLRLAFENMRKEGVVIPFILGAMENFSFDKKYDLITIVCDGLNYIKGRNLVTTLGNVKKHLTEQGTLVCDISSEYKLTEILSSNFFYEDYEDKTIFWTNKLSVNKKHVDMCLSVFTKVGELYKREDENHRQFAHSEADIVSAAESVGLEILKIIDGNTFGKVTPKSQRLTFVMKNK